MSVCGASNTVRVTYLDGTCPSTVHEAVEELTAFGEIARLDTSLSAIRGCILVTYFDVRSAQRLMLEYSGCTEPFPAAVHDVRSVRTSMSAFFSLVGVNGGVEVFGDVADLSTVGKEVVIEFYDIRAAHRFLAAAGGSATPVLSNSRSGLSGSSAWPQQGAHNPAYLLAGPGSPGSFADGTPSGSLESLARAAIMAETEAAASFEGLQESGVETNGNSNVAAGNSPNNNSNANVDARKEKNKQQDPAAKAPRSKVTSKEFQKFEINAESISNGKDKRTTVMVRRLTGPNARSDLEGLLERCGLGKRYNFFYMPCKEHRNVHAGFAFVNFVSPDDVLRLHNAMESGMWAEVTGSADSKSPLVSYARFQGQTELMSHFSSSAIMRDQDPNKRPMFRPSSDDAVVEAGPPGLVPPVSSPAKAKSPSSEAKKIESKSMMKVAEVVNKAGEDQDNLLDTSAGA